MNNWKKIWNGREKVICEANESDESIFLKLKMMSGFDAATSGISYRSFREQYLEMTKALSKHTKLESVFEIGCGAGANLLLLERDGFEVGGIDYSDVLIKTAKAVLNTADLQVGEASNITTDKQYDGVISNSVFGYFVSEDYATDVLNKAIRKAKQVVGILDVHDEAYKEEHLALQRQLKENYDERYKDLPIQFYSKAFFREFAQVNHLEVEFAEMGMPEYWNSRYSFNVFLYLTDKTKSDGLECALRKGDEDRRSSG